MNQTYNLKNFSILKTNVDVSGLLLRNYVVPPLMFTHFIIIDISGLWYGQKCPNLGDTGRPESLSVGPNLTRSWEI